MASLSKNELEIIITAVDKASKDLNDIKKKINELGGEADKSSGQVSKAGAAVATLGTIAKTAAIAIAAAATAAATAGLAVGIGFNSSVEQASAKLMAFMKDGSKVAQTLAWVKDEAAKTQFSFTDMADAAANLTPVAKTSGQSLEALVKQAEILAALNPTEGLTGATFSLREALSGDWVSIVDRFNLPRQRINELKQQGVPAMEIISRTLGEMGIDYGLVAAQGQTAAARFDQIKDKLTMMAGAATKPIFDRLSKDLDVLANNDFVGWGERAAVDIGKFMTWIDKLWSQFVFLLSPAINDLVKAYNENLQPSIVKLQPVFEAFGAFLGMTLVVLIFGLINALKLLVQAVGWVGSAITWSGDRLAEFAWNGGQALLWIRDRFNEFRDAVGRVWSFVSTLDWGRALGGVARGIGNSIIGMIEGAINGALKGLPGSPKVSIPRFARGTNFAPGGLALVGEEGPELVNLPRGSQVRTAGQTRQALSQAGSGAQVNVTQNIYNQIDYDRGIAELGFKLRFA